jgi:predicted ABC-type ATPase
VPEARPSVVVLSGPNGAGKSTMAARLLVGSLRVSEYVDADAFARGMPRSETAGVTAGRAVLRRLDELASGRRSFGFETTLASRSFGPRIRALIGAGYQCHLVFLWLPSADFAVDRVADRVRLGGHNSTHEPRLIASGAGTETLTVNDADLWRRIREDASP